MTTHQAVQHVPNFVDTDHRRTADFNSVGELLSVDWVKSYLEWEQAEQFAKSRHGDLLMITNNSHTWWWCVARVPEGSIDILPECEYNEKD